MNSHIQKHLDSILQSKEFVNSESSKRLLSYLVQESLENRAPKEIDIAITIFGRDSSYDPSTDSLVRSHMYALRNKLEKYYLTEGNNDAVRLSIPKGHYEVRFKRKSSETSSERFKMRFRRFLSKAFIALLFLYSLVASILLLQHQQNKPEIDLAQLGFPWQDFLNTQNPTLLTVGDLFFFLEQGEDSLGYLRIRNGRINSLEDLFLHYTTHPENKDNFSGMTYYYMNPSFMDAIMLFSRAFFPADINIKYKSLSELDQLDIKNNNIIYLGIFKTLGPLHVYFEKSHYNFQHYPHELFVKDANDTTKLQSFEAAIGHGLNYNKAYTAVIKTPGPNENVVLLITGFAAEGINAVAKDMLSEKFQTMINESFPNEFSSQPRYFQALVENDIISGETVVNRLLHFAPIEKHNTP